MFAFVDYADAARSSISHLKPAVAAEFFDCNIIHNIYVHCGYHPIFILYYTDNNNVRLSKFNSPSASCNTS